MLSRITFLITLCLTAFSTTAQYEDFDIDSVHFVQITEDPNAYELYDVRLMNYLTDKNREESYFIFVDNERVLYQIRNEEIDDNNNFIKVQTNIIETLDIDDDFYYEATYDNNTLLETKTIDKFENYDEVEEHATRLAFEDFDQFGNPETKKEFITKPGENETLNKTLNFQHTYQDENLLLTRTELINPTTGEATLISTQHNTYNQDNQVIIEEGFNIDLSGTQLFNYKIENFYLENGLLDFKITSYSNLDTPDLTDGQPFLKIQYVYNSNNKVIEEQYSKYTDDLTWDLSDIVYIFRSGPTSVKTSINPPEHILVSTIGQNQIYVQLEELDISQEYSLKVVSQNGIVISEMSIEGIKSWANEIDVPGGVYFVSLVSGDGGRQSEKVVVF